VQPVLLALGALAIAPLLDAAAARKPALGDLLDGFVLVGVTGIVLGHVLPPGWQAVGWQALAALALGLGLASVGHRHPALEGHRSAFAFLALLVHAIFDGVGLAHPEGEAGQHLAQAIVLHTLPVGVGAWRMATAQGGTRLALVVTLATAGATVVGYLVAGWLAPSTGASGGLLLQCLVAGAILHVVFHQAHGRADRGWTAAGGALGLFSVLLSG
jgi:hypothetical protein